MRARLVPSSGTQQPSTARAKHRQTARNAGQLFCPRNTPQSAPPSALFNPVYRADSAPVQLRLPTIRRRRGPNATSAAAIASVAPIHLKNRRKSVAPPSAEFQVSCRPENSPEPPVAVQLPTHASPIFATPRTSGRALRSAIIPALTPCLKPSFWPSAISLENPSSIKGGRTMPFLWRKPGKPARHAHCSCRAVAHDSRPWGLSVPIGSVVATAWKRLRRHNRHRRRRRAAAWVAVGYTVVARPEGRRPRIAP